MEWSTGSHASLATTGANPSEGMARSGPISTPINVPECSGERETPFTRETPCSEFSLSASHSPEALRWRRTPLPISLTLARPPPRSDTRRCTSRARLRRSAPRRNPRGRLAGTRGRPGGVALEVHIDVALGDRPRGSGSWVDRQADDLPSRERGVEGGARHLSNGDRGEPGRRQAAGPHALERSGDGCGGPGVSDRGRENVRARLRHGGLGHSGVGPPGRVPRGPKCSELDVPHRSSQPGAGLGGREPPPHERHGLEAGGGHEEPGVGHVGFGHPEELVRVGVTGGSRGKERSARVVLIHELAHRVVGPEDELTGRRSSGCRLFVEKNLAHAGVGAADANAITVTVYGSPGWVTTSIRSPEATAEAISSRPPR